MPRITLAAAWSLAVLAVAAWVAPASAANVNIDWLVMSPPAFGSVVPNASVYTVAGVGNVTVTYSIPVTTTHFRTQNVSYVVGNVVFGPNNYQWTNHEYFGSIFSGPDLGPEAFTITYTFPLQPAGSVYIGSIGLGATTSFGGGTSTTTVNQNGTFLGDYNGMAGFGATLFVGGAGTFTLQNSVTGAGGVDPHWNSQLGVVRIDDAVSSVTVHQSGLRGDGIGVNIGFSPDLITPTETSTWGRVKQLYR